MAVQVFWRVWKWIAQWRVWKWLTHLFTGKCELHRICLSKIPLEDRAWRLEQSLKNSKSPALRQVVEGGEDVEEAMSVIAREKKLDLGANVELARRLREGLVRVVGVTVLYEAVEGLRAHQYSQENEKHEKMLMELWSQLMPGEPLKARLSKQWQEIGFQGNNPATDFRSMGVLSVYCLLFFATRHRDQARSVLSHSHHPQHTYPFALVGIHLAGLLHSWLQRRILSRYLYTTTSQWPPTMEGFHEIFCYLFCRFDQFWLEKKPENVMAFPQVKKEFAEQIQAELSAKNITVRMRLQNTE